VQRKGVRVSVVSTMRSAPPMVADELRRQADNFIELQEIMPHIARARTDGQQQGGQPNLKEVAQNMADTHEDIQDVA
jgi:hypothetical protein